MTVNTNGPRPLRTILPMSMHDAARRYLLTCGKYSYEPQYYISPEACEQHIERDTQMTITQWRESIAPPFADAMRLARVALAFMPKRCPEHGAWTAERIGGIGSVYSVTCRGCRDVIRVMRALIALREALDVPVGSELDEPANGG